MKSQAGGHVPGCANGNIWRLLQEGQEGVFAVLAGIVQAIELRRLTVSNVRLKTDEVCRGRTWQKGSARAEVEKRLGGRPRACEGRIG